MTGVTNPMVTDCATGNSNIGGISLNKDQAGVLLEWINQNIDPNFASVSLLLHGEGTNGSTTFTDSSSLNNTLTRTGTGITISTAQKKFGNASINFPGSGTNYLTVTTNPTSFQFGTNDFTLEMWVYVAVSFPGTDDMYLYSSRNGGSSPECPELVIDQSTKHFQFRSSGSALVTGTTTPLANTWYHVAFCRKGSSNLLFVNGAQEGPTVTDSRSYTTQVAGQPVTLGINTFNFTSALFNGYLDEVRVTKGLARYTSNFTPPTQAFPNS
jgi:hypothetical protein